MEMRIWKCHCLWHKIQVLAEGVAHSIINEWPLETLLLNAMHLYLFHKRPIIALRNIVIKILFTNIFKTKEFTIQN